MNVSITFLALSSHFYHSPTVNQNYLRNVQLRKCIFSKYFSTFLKFSNFNFIKIDSTTFKTGLSKAISLNCAFYNKNEYDSRLAIGLEQCLIANSVFSYINNNEDGGAIYSEISLNIVNTLVEKIRCHEASIMSYGHLAISKCSFIDIEAENSAAISSRSVLNSNITINETIIKNINSNFLFAALYIQTCGFCFCNYMNSSKTQARSWVGFCQFANPLLYMSFITVNEAESENNGAVAANNCYKMNITYFNFIECKQTIGTTVSAAALFLGIFHFPYNIGNCIFHNCHPGNGFVVSCEGVPLEYLHDCFVDQQMLNDKKLHNENIQFINLHYEYDNFYSFDEIPIGYDEENTVAINQSEAVKNPNYQNNPMQSPIVIASFASLFACVIKFLIDIVIKKYGLNHNSKTIS